MSVLFCADSITLQHPEYLGVQEHDFDRDVFTTCSLAEQARGFVNGSPELSEVWIAGADNIDALNLGAAIKQDRAGVNVRVLTGDKTGSTISKAERAGIDSVLSVEEFATLYYKMLSSAKNGFNQAAEFRPQREISNTPQISAFKSKQASSVNANCWCACVVGTNGGCGKSSLTSVYASLVSALEKSTLVIDADFIFGDMKRIIKGAESASICDVLQDTSVIENLAAKSTGGIPALIYPTEAIEVAEEEKLHIVEVIKQCKNYFDCIIINTSNSVDEVLIDIMNECSANLFVLDQRPTCIENVRKIRDLAGKMNMSEQTFAFCLNRCSRNAIYRPSDICGALSVNSVFQLDDGGESVEELLSNGEMLTLLEEKNDFAKSVFEMICQSYPPCMTYKTSKKSKRSR